MSSPPFSEVETGPGVGDRQSMVGSCGTGDIVQESSNVQH